MEQAGDIMNQKEIAANYVNDNVDLGRYSDLDISNEPRESLAEIITKIDEYQEKSNFTYINMIPRTLDDIILREQKTFGYMNRNFVLMLFLLFFNNFIKENLIIFSSYYMIFQLYKNKNDSIINEVEKVLTNIKEKNNEDLRKKSLDYANENLGAIQIICLLSSSEFLLQILSIFFIMPFYKINLRFKNNLIIFMIISIVLMITLSFIDFYEGFEIYIYVPLVSIDIMVHKIIETISSCYLVYLIPPKWKYSHIRACSLPTYLMLFGKVLGCLFCLASFSKDKIEFNQHFLVSVAFLFYGIIGLYIYKSKNFRISSLSGILRQKALE